MIKTSQEVKYGITSLSREKASPKRVMQVRRKHWLAETRWVEPVETGLHYRRDVTLHKDFTRTTKAAAGRILARIHNPVLALIFNRAGWFSECSPGSQMVNGHVNQAFALLISANSRL